MGVCPICNGLNEMKQKCHTCGEKMIDRGREMDFYDDYSAYMPIDLMKLENGYPHDLSDGKCAHLFQCSVCGNNETIFIQE